MSLLHLHHLLWHSKSEIVSLLDLEFEIGEDFMGLAAKNFHFEGPDY